MTEEEVRNFFQRIDELTSENKPLFGKMNVNQMICHCTDQLRLAMGAKNALEYGKVNATEMLSLAKSGKPVPTPKGFGQTEGEGTNPTNFENDINLLKEHILMFSKLGDDFSFSIHPYFGQLDKNLWNGMVAYHLNHHLKQFSV
ncbi:MAG TPA: DUF1569 domain-containing protein [Hanamia sp.]|nr:DUF1569 domain-containing protein [Hanamia sp.]